MAGTAVTHQSAPDTQHFTAPPSPEAPGLAKQMGGGSSTRGAVSLAEGRLLQPRRALGTAALAPPAASSAGRDWPGPGVEEARPGVGQTALGGAAQDCSSPVGGGLGRARLLPFGLSARGLPGNFRGGEAASGPGCLPGGKEQEPVRATRRGDGRKGHPLLPSPGDPAGLPAALRHATPLTRETRHARHGGQSRERGRACPALSGPPPGLPGSRPRRRPPSGACPPGRERSPRTGALGTGRPGRAAAPLTSWRPLGRSPRRSWRPAAPGRACPGPRRCCPSRDPRRRRTAAPRWRRRRQRRRAGKRRPRPPRLLLRPRPRPNPPRGGTGGTAKSQRGGTGRGSIPWQAKPAPTWGRTPSPRWAHCFARWPRTRVSRGVACGRGLRAGKEGRTGPGLGIKSLHSLPLAWEMPRTCRTDLPWPSIARPVKPPEPGPS